MCWSGTASYTIAGVGFSGGFWALWKKENAIRIFSIFYFSIMELLQALTYGVVSVCVIGGLPDGKLNEILTILSYIHISFHPIVIPIFGISFSKKAEEAKKTIKKILPFLIFSTLLMLGKFFLPKDIFGECGSVGKYLCSNDTCSYFGEWHIAWRLAFNGSGEFNFFGLNLSLHYIFYFFSFFVVPIIYGSWRFSLYLFIGFFLAFVSTRDAGEWTAIWCITSVLSASGVILTPIKNWLETPLRKD